jgi:tripartite-type tricarboxylate transporter receptor subunit TctC
MRRLVTPLIRVLVAALLAVTTLAHAADPIYPNRSVRLVVPFPAGGTTDVIARLVGQKLSASLQQQFVIDNRPGAGGNIGADMVAKAPADGYTLLLGTVSSHSINPSLYARMPYDAMKDFAPISLLATSPNVLVVNPSLSARSVQELVTLAKAKPGTLTFASGGNGTTHHLAGELFKRMAGVDMIHVPYKGNAPAITDVIGGQVNLMFDNVGNSLPHIKAGKLRALAVTGPARTSVLPNVPTLAELGFAGFNITPWFGLFAPARTPPAILQRLNVAVNAALHESQVRDLIATEGMEAQGNSPEQFRTFLQGESVRWSKLVKESGARID